jgi:hypothetical protein
MLGESSVLHLYLDMTSNQVLSDVKGRLVYYLDMTTNQVQMHI